MATRLISMDDLGPFATDEDAIIMSDLMESLGWPEKENEFDETERDEMLLAWERDFNNCLTKINCQ